MPYKMRGGKDNLRIEDFMSVVPWEQIEERMLKKDYRKFVRFMRGQTCTRGGVYPEDLARFLKGKAVID